MSFGKFRQARDQMKQMKELKATADAMQKQLSTIIVEADSGHGAVTVTVSGQQKLLTLKISPKVVDPNKSQLLEELVMKAVNDGMNKAQKAAARQMMASGDFKLPGLG